jgi:hypothetical protein
MAKIKLVAPVSDIRGELGGVVYSNWKGIAYTRDLATAISNPESLAQEAVRASLSSLSQRWLSTLTDAQRAAWEEYAQQRGSAKGADRVVGYKSLMPDLGKIMTGKNAYVSTNAQLGRWSIAPVDDAPLGINAPGAPTTLAVSYVAGPPKKHTLTWVDPAGMDAAGYICIWGESPKLFHRQLVAVVEHGVQTYDVTQMRGAGGELLSIVSGIYRYQVCAWDSHGQRGPGGNIVSNNIV